jgi:2-dehydro-3-deoxygalactonokinase
MSSPAYIAGDWGTSHLRLFLCARDGEVLDSREGAGAAQSRGRFPEIFDGLVADWNRTSTPLPAVLCGMAGSTFGWVETPYLLCPEELGNVAGSLTQARDRVFIVPGLKCANPLGAPDVLRGEETQVLGALSLTPALQRGRHLLCLPGTHTKWISVLDGVVIEFLTVPTGELFRLLCDHSVLVREAATTVEHLATEFERGLVEAVKHRSVPVLHRLFQSRSLRIDQQLSAQGAASWTSGLLIGTDVGGALPLFDSHSPDAPVYVVGAPALTTLYSTALARHGRSAGVIDGNAASLAGLANIHASITFPGASA